jgi:ubiquinone/menaquinone biosynthesis C-methylase UbiE
MDMLRGGYAGSIPTNYDRYLRPFFFENFASDLVRRLRRTPNMRILELACGTGVVTACLARMLDKDLTIMATDLSQPMIDCARTHLGESSVTWQAADALELPFGDASFDAVLCQFGWMFFPDKGRAAHEAHRVLKPGGQLLFNVWESLERNEPPRVVQSTLERVLGDKAPSFLRIPYGCGDAEGIAHILADAGFADIHISPVELECESESAQAAARGMIEGTPSANELAAHGPDVLRQALREAEKALIDRFGEGTLRTKLYALVCTGVAA